MELEKPAKQTRDNKACRNAESVPDRRQQQVSSRHDWLWNPQARKRVRSL
jgi:hypothetical protein